MKTVVVMLGVAGLCLSTAALCDDQLALAKKSGCLNCHSVDKKIVGPAWKDVATKYHGNADASAMLVKKVGAGGSGVWGAIPMPPNSPKVPEADIKTLVDWILSL
jgi:cytochrome c